MSPYEYVGNKKFVVFDCFVLCMNTSVNLI